MAKHVGRPTLYNDEILAKCDDYIRDYKKLEEAIPTIVGLAIYLDINKDTAYEWAKRYPEFSDKLNRVSEMQEQKLVTGGVNSTFNPTITKLLLNSKHGYIEKVQTDNTNTDIVIEFGSSLQEVKPVKKKKKGLLN